MEDIPIPDFGAATKQVAAHAVVVLGKLKSENPAAYGHVLEAIGRGAVLEITYLLDVGQARISFAIRAADGARAEFARVPVTVDLPSSLH